MGCSTFQAGTCICIDNRTLMLTRKVDDQIWQLEESKTRRIVEFSDNHLRALYSAGKLSFYKEPTNCPCGSAGKAHREVSARQFEEAKIRRAYVHAVLDLPNTRALTKSAIRAIWNKLQKPLRCPDWITVYRWKRRYLAAGKDIYALVDQSFKKGNRSSRYPKEVVDIAEKAINQVYLSRERKTIEDTLEKALWLVDQENKLRPEALRLPRPTRRLITSLIQKIPAFDRAIARDGREAARRRFRAVLKHRTTEHPLQRAEIDHTQLDIFVIDDETGLPLGRPWITVCIDDYTRCILGIFISFEPPSYFTVSQCLRDAFTPKQWLKEHYPEIKHRWDAHGVMQELVVDNGLEFHSEALELACFSLGIEIHYSARKTPWFKGKIERFLGTLNGSIAHGTPGTTFSNILEKDDYDPVKHAVVRLSTLRNVVRIWIADYYHQKPHRTLGQPPAVLWNGSIVPEDIALPDDMEGLDVILGRPESRILTHKGIELDGLLYNSPEMTLLRRAQGDKLPVEVRINDSNLGSIIVLSPDRSTRFTVPALRQDYASGLTRWQHKVCKRFSSGELRRYDPSGWLEAKEEITRLIQRDLTFKKQKSRSRAKRFTTTSRELIEQATPVNSGPSQPKGVVGVREEKATALMPTTIKRFSPVITSRLTNSPTTEFK